MTITVATVAAELLFIFITLVSVLSDLLQRLLAIEPNAKTSPHPPLPPQADREATKSTNKNLIIKFIF